MIAGTSVPELLSVHANDILKKGGGSEKINEEAIEEALDKVIILLFGWLYEFIVSQQILVFTKSDLQIVQLLVYIHEKDIFAEFYRYPHFPSSYTVLNFVSFPFL